MKTIEMMRNFRLLALFFVVIAISSCNNDDNAAPEEENEVEVITDVTLIFTPQGGGTAIRAKAQDPDGTGSRPLELVDPAITLATDTSYTLTFEILNALDPADVEDIGEEIEEEDDEHQIFFSFTDGAFANPTGDGNIDTASDPIIYEDEDSDAQDGSGNPVGLVTSWVTSGTASAGGNFTVLLKHQPDVKTATSDSNTGDTDFNLTFVLNIQ